MIRPKENRPAGRKRFPVAAAVLLAASLLLTGCSLEQIEQAGRELMDLLPFREAVQEPVTADSAQPAEQDVQGEDGQSIFGEFSLRDIVDGDKYQDNLPETESLFRNVFRTGYYYTCLTEEEKAIYDALLAVTDDPTSTEYRKGVRTALDPQAEIFAQEISRAYQAMIFDHPERFWFRKESSVFGYYYPAVPDLSGMYTVEFRLTQAYTDYEEEMRRFNEAVDLFFSDIDLNQSQPALALQIHDKLMDMVTYDDALAGTFQENGSGFDYGYTAYGALVENSRGEAHTAVCDGYSYAYEYLLQQAGITATRIGGKAGDSAETANPHSWNLVCLDGEWYETDVTWDDREVIVDPADPAYELYLEAMQDEYYWEKIRHHLFQLTTQEMALFEPDDSYTYYAGYGYASFLGSSVHIRDTEENREEEDMLSWLAPYAEGVRYTYDFFSE